jgi:hypothetical protein
MSVPYSDRNLSELVQGVRDCRGVQYSSSAACIQARSQLTRSQAPRVGSERDQAGAQLLAFRTQA